MCIADGKVGIVSGNDRFMLDCFPKFAAVVCAPGNDRVRINRMVPVRRCGRRESRHRTNPSKKTKTWNCLARWTRTHAKARDRSMARRREGG